MDDIAITTGCNMAFLSILMTLCPPNTSEVLIPLPTYFNNAMSLSLQSVKAVYIPCDSENEFKPNIQSARSYLQKAFPGGNTQDQDQDQGDIEGGGKTKPKMIVLVNPSNPTGAIYSHQDLKDWYELAKEFNLALVLDETYREFVDDEEVRQGQGRGMGVPHRLFEESDWRETLISLGSFSSKSSSYSTSIHYLDVLR